MRKVNVLVVVLALFALPFYFGCSKQQTETAKAKGVEVQAKTEAVVTEAGAAVDIAGTWGVSASGPMGPEKWDLTITKMDGDNIKILVKHGFIGKIEGTGTYKDGMLKWSATVQAMGVELWEFEGVVTGDTIKGTSKKAGKATGPWSAKKK